MAKAKRTAPARKKRGMKKSAKKIRTKATPAPMTPQLPAPLGSTLMFGGFFGTKTNGQ